MYVVGRQDYGRWVGLSFYETAEEAMKDVLDDFNSQIDEMKGDETVEDPDDEETYYDDGPLEKTDDFGVAFRRLNCEPEENCISVVKVDMEHEVSLFNPQTVRLEPGERPSICDIPGYEIGRPNGKVWNFPEDVTLPWNSAIQLGQDDDEMEQKYAVDPEEQEQDPRNFPGIIRGRGGS